MPDRSQVREFWEEYGLPPGRVPVGERYSCRVFSSRASAGASEPLVYRVRQLLSGEWQCECLDWVHRGGPGSGYQCKHIKYVRQFFVVTVSTLDELL